MQLYFSRNYLRRKHLFFHSHMKSPPVQENRNPIGTHQLPLGWSSLSRLILCAHMLPYRPQRVGMMCMDNM
jgi:hypothetical protein